MQKQTELITNKDGSIFHLNLLPGDIANKIIIVGDPGRVDMLCSLMTDIRVRKENREFHTVTGSFDNSEITVISVFSKEPVTVRNSRFSFLTFMSVIKEASISTLPGSPTIIILFAISPGRRLR